ncbi:hypothetical protein [Neisseria dumasiana]|uniref:Uncharacterized protein n=1 Tax=Neisseria dumasiana TaxID=1931275 RepID=A0A1X3DL03_9NEIS|nr:hypothetical protein [Neisseria dumasiana]OSI25066.1 hypothetical protein BV912_01435 [Neisseria dumasiana]
MAKAKTGQTVETTVDVKPEEATLAAALQAEADALKAELGKAKAEIQALQAELAAAQTHNTELEKALEEAVFVSGEADGISDDKTLTPDLAAGFYAGSNAPAKDAEVVAIKSKHGHAFWRAGYQVQSYWTFVRRADFEPDDFSRLIGDRLSEVREALPKAAS